MARVLVLERDPLFAAVIEDRLLVSGHQTHIVSDPALAVSTTTEGGTDLLIMELDLPVVSGIDIVRRLRQQPETRSLPILALSSNDTSGSRIEALRAGVDDYLAKPCDPEELMLRLDRLVGRRGVAPPPLSGDLASHPIWGLLQYIQQADKSGDLMIHSPKGSGKVVLVKGRVVSAHWQRLRDRDALLTIVDMKEGSFRLTTVEYSGDEPAPGDAIRIPDVLIESAWIQDHLAERRQHLPATSAALELITDALPPIEEAFANIPIDKVFQLLHRESGLRLYDLMSDSREAPSKVRLAVAWLAEHGVVKPVEQTPADTMSTVEISSSMVLDLAVHSLLSAARDAGFDVSALPYLMLAEPGVWPELQQLPASVPGFLRHEALRKLVDRTRGHQGGSATFTTNFGKLSLHIQPLTSAVKQQMEAIVPACAGVLLWLDQAEEKELVRGVVERLEASGEAAAGVLVATSPTAFEAASELTAGTTKWQTSTHAPSSLLGVLRLLQPRRS